MLRDITPRVVQGCSKQWVPNATSVAYVMIDTFAPKQALKVNEIREIADRATLFK